MGKRTINQSTNKSAKKVKADPALAPIVEAIAQADDLPERCQTMLIDTLPLALSVPSDKRHEIQASIVDMVKQTLDAKKVAMEAAVAVEEQKITGLESARADRVKVVDEAEGSLKTQKEAVQSAKSVLADVTVAVNACLKTLEERQQEHKISADKIATAQTEKTALESAFEAHFKPIKEGVEGPHLKELEPYLKNLDIEASLLIAVPSSCQKPLAERGSFDTVVLDELEKALSSKIAALGSTISAETPIARERETGMLGAQEEYNAKKDTQKRAAADLETLQKEECDREGVLKTAQKAANETQPEIDAAKELLEAAKAKLEAFEAGPLAKFVACSTATSVTEEVANTESAPLGA